MDEYVLVQVSSTIRVKSATTVRVPMDVWYDRKKDERWGDVADKYLRENLDLDYTSSLDFDESDIEIDDAALVTD